MTTDKQRQANKQNALLSTGPNTNNGKMTVAKNAITHGIFAKDLIINTGDGRENELEYYELLEDLKRDLGPANRVEMLLVEKIAVNYWRLKRLLRYETGEIRHQLDEYREAALHSHYSSSLYTSQRPELRLYSYDDDISDEDYQQQIRRVVALQNRSSWIFQDRKSLEYILYYRLDYEDSDLTEEDYTAAQNYIDNLSPQLKGKLRREMLEDAEETLAEMDVVKTWRTKFDRIQKAKSLPSSRNIDNIIKYENSLERSIFKNMSALKVMQENRCNAVRPETVTDIEEI